MMKFFELFRQPEARRICDLDDPAATLLHAEILRKKPFLKRLYTDFYKQLGRSVCGHEKKILVEVGSGGGFIKEVISNVITSDILDLPNVDRVFSVFDMPFEGASVDAIFMVNVFHHITNPRFFLAEALRCLKVFGKIVMIEPANTLFGRFIYSNLHHELFDPEAGWELEEVGPLSHGNGALPWIIFRRDRKIFEREFPSLRIVRMYNHTALRYLLSGGFSFRQLVPSCSYPIIKAIESMLYPVNDFVGMFQTIELEKTDIS